MATYNTNSTTADYGNNNAAVGSLQTYLNSKGAGLDIDNKYGDLTRQAVQKYGLPSNNNISVSSITPTQKINLGTPQVDDSASLLGTSLQASSYVNNLTNNSNTAEQNLNKSQNDITSTMEALLNKTSDTQIANESSGLNSATKQLNDLNAQAQSLNREALAIPIQTQQRNANTGATDRGVAPQDTGALRENALKSLSIAQQADIASANYTAAKDKAQEIIDLKYKPLEKALEIKKQQYEFNKDTLTRVDKKRAEALDIAIKKEERELADKKEQEKDVQSILLEAAKNGASSEIQNSISTATTVSEAIKIAGNSLVTPATDVVKLDNGSTILIDKRTGQVIKNFGGGKSTGGGKNTINGSRMFNALINTTSSLEGTVSGKDATKIQLYDYLEAGDYPSAYNQIANTVEQSLTGETKNRFANSRVDYEVLTGFGKALDSYIDGGGDTGLLKGTAEQIERKLGSVSNPKLAALAVQLQREFQTYRNTMTGAAFTPKESREYESVNPSSKKSLNLNQVVVEGALNQLKNRVDGTIRAKVPQVTDVVKLMSVPENEQVAKVKIDKIYTSSSQEVASIIENLVDKGFTNLDVYDYLDAKGYTQ